MDCRDCTQKVQGCTKPCKCGWFVWSCYIDTWFTYSRLRVVHQCRHIFGADDTTNPRVYSPNECCYLHFHMGISAEPIMCKIKSCSSAEASVIAQSNWLQCRRHTNAHDKTEDGCPSLDDSILRNHKAPPSSSNRTLCPSSFFPFSSRLPSSSWASC